MTAPAREGLDRLRVLQDALEIVDAVAANMNGAPASTSTRDADVVAGDLADAFDVAFDENWPGAVIDVLRATPPEPSSEVVEEVEDTVRELREAELDWLDCGDTENAALAKSAYSLIQALASRQPTPAPAADAEVREAFERFVDTVDRLGRGNNAIHDAIIEARTALAASPKAPSVAIGAGEVERLLAFARGGPMTWRREGSGGASTDYNALRADILAALTPASASIPADVEREADRAFRRLIDAAGVLVERTGREAGFYREWSAADRAVQAARKTLAARPSTGGAMDGEGA